MFGGWVPPPPFAVQYFFTLSGFVMLTAHHQDLAKPKASLRFLRRRSCGIYPVFWLSLLTPALAFAAALAIYAISTAAVFLIDQPLQRLLRRLPV